MFMYHLTRKFYQMKCNMTVPRLQTTVCGRNELVEKTQLLIICLQHTMVHRNNLTMKHSLNQIHEGNFSLRKSDLPLTYSLFTTNTAAFLITRK